ncbi:Uncharacterised protein [Mycobacterium tuberculosis]|nr:Uncharacterised protein [Mycobacterium tuberculosis]
MIPAVAIVFATDSAVIATGSGPADVMMLAMARCWAWANDHSL